MNRRDYLLGLAALAVSGAPVAAQSFPVRPVILANGYPPGGSTDVAARLVGEGMSAGLGGQRVIVENRPGASGTVAAAWMKRQDPDGYALLLSESSSFAIWPAMHAEGVKYDPRTDFDWVATICTAPMVLIVSPDFPARTLPEAVEVLRSSKSADLNYSSSGAGFDSPYRCGVCCAISWVPAMPRGMSPIVAGRRPCSASPRVKRPGAWPLWVLRRG